ncbi:uncharacterized protein LOC122964990 [Acropora millepora]|uniref:uncharacterized protein LOC122964990 n=1 Tax=Acropora millepora TaxID=45264 RepID=UPI001CF269CF|nr:uncharacterized protein LOC122964990 [Acropora millepora]
MKTKRGSSSLVHRVYRAMTEEVSCERSRVSGGNCSNVEEELSRNFQIPRYHSLFVYKLSSLPCIIRKLQEMGLIVDGFPLDKNWDVSQLKLHEC